MGAGKHPEGLSGACLHPCTAPPRARPQAVHVIGSTRVWCPGLTACCRRPLMQTPADGSVVTAAHQRPVTPLRVLCASAFSALMHAGGFGQHDGALSATLIRRSAAGVSRTSAVQPAWWLAPRPSPVSPLPRPSRCAVQGQVCGFCRPPHISPSAGARHFREIAGQIRCDTLACCLLGVGHGHRIDCRGR